MKPLHVLLIGSAGRMGQTIIDLAGRDMDLEIVERCDQGDAVEPAMKNCDVAIDFTHASATDAICRACLDAGKPLVIGTTGHSPAQRCAIETTAQSVAIVFASNFSVGVNALFALTRKAAEILGDEFRVEISETHHRMKKDAPSGTAKTLAEVLQALRPGHGEVAIESMREGEVVGEHRVIFTGPGERLELLHHADTREIFARGALRAARWIVGQPPALYSMQDVLGLTHAR